MPNFNHPKRPCRHPACQGRQSGAFAQTLFIFIPFLAAAVALGQTTLPDSIDPLVLQAGDVSQDAYSRRMAVSDVIAQSDAKAIGDLNTALTNTTDVTLVLMIAREIASREGEAPEALASALIDRMQSAEEPVRGELAQAAGRYRLDSVSNRLVLLARDGDADAGARAAAIAALSYDPNQRNAELLMLLTDPSEPARVRQAAFDGLARLSGISTFGDDANKWQAWWETHRSLAPMDWYADLTNRLTRRNDALRRTNQRISDRLLSVQRLLYRATPEDQREALLASMMSDTDQTTRRLALELASQRFIDQQPFGQALITALLSGLDDSESSIRQGSAKLLRSINPKNIADIMARRLIDGREQDPDVLREYLLMMTEYRSARAVERSMLLMSNPRLRDEAAGVLVGAAQRGDLSEEHRNELHDRLQEYLTADHTPSPQIIELLGYVGDDANWQQIRKWIDNDNDEVKAAAAQAWGRSDRPLALLARRAGDPVIQPIVIAAADRRGRTLDTCIALLEHRPQQPQAEQAWRRALVSIAGRAESVQVLRMDDLLIDGEYSSEFREQVLSAAINTMLPPAVEGAAPTKVTDPTTLVDLLLRRADVRMKLNQPKAAVADLSTVVQGGWQVQPEQMSRYQAMMMGAKLASDEVAGAFLLAQEVLKQASELGMVAHVETADVIASLFLARAEWYAANSHPAEARAIIKQLREIVGPVISDAAQKRLVDVEKLIVDTPAPPAPPTESPDGIATPPANSG